jgi:hypothetical protein
MQTQYNVLIEGRFTIIIITPLKKKKKLLLFFFVVVVFFCCAQRSINGFSHRALLALLGGVHSIY